MKELVQWFLIQIPKYITNFEGVFVSPKTFIGRRNRSNDDSLPKALTFLAISTVFAALLNLSLIPDEENLWEFMTFQAVANLLWVILVAVALRMAWSCVGGRAPFVSFLITYSYYFGVMLVLIKLTHLCALGILKVFEEDLFNNVIAIASGADIPLELHTSAPVIIAFLLLGTGYIGFGVWLIVGWGAYRQLNGLSKFRSFLAGTIFLLLSGFVFAFQLFVERTFT